ncbi:hypothetical protein AC1031_018296 [Aphanomyces cochlioides]|nr:hypothetical protein AC1031_018296 [Aphanomyces cochlioides]
MRVSIALSDQGRRLLCVAPSQDSQGSIRSTRSVLLQEVQGGQSEDQFTTPRGPNLVPGLMRGAGHYVNEKNLAHGQ